MPLKLDLPLSFSPTSSVVPRMELRTGLREFSPPYAHRRAAGSKSSLPLLCWIWSPEVVIYTVRVWNCEVPLLGTGSRLLPLRDLEVGYVGFIINACAGA